MWQQKLQGLNLPARLLRLCMQVGLVTALAAPLSGCVVNSSATRGTVVIQWVTGSGYTCSQLGIVSVNTVVTKDGLPYGTFTNGVCSSGSQTIVLGVGTYSITVQGVDATGKVVAQATPGSVYVSGSDTQYATTVILQPVGASTGNSSIAVTWTVAGASPLTGCAQNGIQTVVVSIVDSSKTKVLASAQAACSLGGLKISNLAPMTFYVQLDGYTAQDAQGAPSWGNANLTGPQNLDTATDLSFQNPIDMVKLTGGTTPTGKGDLTVNWTVFGQAAAAGCATYSINNLAVTVFGADKTQLLATQQVACSAGQVKFSALPAGTRYVQIDEANPPDNNSYGSVNMTGPVTIVSDQSIGLQAPIDIGQRTIIALPIAFANAGSCAANGVSNVRFKVKGNDTVIVPFLDADATKPCDLSTATYAQRVIDLKNSPPQCAVPAGLQGLVVCNAAGYTKVTVDAQGLIGNAISFAGELTATPIKDGTLTKLTTALSLQSCSAGDPLCQP